MKKSVFVMSLFAVFGLTACNQNNSQTRTQQSPTNASVATQHKGMNHDITASVSSTSQPAHVMAYMDMMTKMHDDMANGVQAKNADVGFAKGMIPHHQGAIEMAEIELQYGKDTEMKARAQKIIDTQQGEITFMNEWLTKNETTEPKADNADEIIQVYQAKNGNNHDAMMQGVMDSNPDVAFAKGMIPHHQGAIDMADVEEKYGKNQQMLNLAKKIKQAQTPEIKQMQDWLAKQSK